ncbi:MAG TPA: 5-(carboxyamino)imidazole ribonucleotide synthase [Chloroflexia bacterium]|nr:5-(carboxyamino)imidazole ribonucleotide synthase [Chloroflexia bacterium]
MITVGVLGGGQLGRMLALAGYPLDMRFRFFDPASDAPVGHLAEHIAGRYTDFEALGRFARGLDVVTYEFENVPVEAVRFLEERVPVYPPSGALSVSQDRVTEKRAFMEYGIPTAPFEAVDTWEGLLAGIERLGLPTVLKTRRMGYDGKGQMVVKSKADAEGALATLGRQPLILEGFVPFSRELSIISVRDRKGNTAFYPLVENHHGDGILRLSLAPAPNLTAELQAQAEGYAARVLDALQYVGVLAIELFETEGKLLANEMAPRVHNSGHWTIEGAETSQFENHLRAIAGLPLGSTGMLGHAAMVNIIGEIPDEAGVLAVPGAHLHLYGKAPRPGRKLGHITLRGDNADGLRARAEGIGVIGVRD